MLPQFQPMPLQKRVSAFDNPDWIFELKYDGFRALAYIEAGECRLVSRKGNQLKSFPSLNLALPLESNPNLLDGSTSWVKIQNPNYSQWVGREEWFKENATPIRMQVGNPALCFARAWYPNAVMKLSCH